MSAASRRAAWRSIIKHWAATGRLPIWQDEGGGCVASLCQPDRLAPTHPNHSGDKVWGAFLCVTCRRVIFRGEGRWWE